jgi:hypothetical protein
MGPWIVFGVGIIFMAYKGGKARLGYKVRRDRQKHLEEIQARLIEAALARNIERNPEPREYATGAR